MFSLRERSSAKRTFCPIYLIWPAAAQIGRVKIIVCRLFWIVDQNGEIKLRFTIKCRPTNLSSGSEKSCEWVGHQYWWFWVKACYSFNIHAYIQYFISKITCKYVVIKKKRNGNPEVSPISRVSQRRDRGCYMPARGYEFYLRVVRCAHSWDIELNTRR